jgi:GNAT superfamily N-acetyltransferase
MGRNNADFHGITTQYIPDSVHHYMEAYLDGSPVAGITWKKSNGAIDQITTKEEHRRKGIGTSLYNAAVEYSATNNLPTPTRKKSRFITPDGDKFFRSLEK